MARHIYNSLKTVLLASKIFGVYPWKGESWSIVGIFSSITFMLTNSLLFAYILINLQFLVPERYDNQLTNEAVDKGLYCMVYVAGMVPIIQTLRNRKNYQTLLTGFETIDDKLEKMGQVVEVVRCWPGIVLRLVMVVGALTFQYFNWKTLGTSELIVGSFIYSLLSSNLVHEKQFSSFLDILGNRFNILTKSLETVEDPIDLVDLHSELVSLANIIQSMFSPQALVIVAQVFALLTVNLYLAIEYIQGKMIEKAALSLFWISVRLYELWSMISSSKYASYQANNFSEVLFNIILDDRTDNLAEDDRLFLFLLKKENVSFTAAELVPLDYTLLHTIVSATTTYLVVLLQFKDQEHQDKS